MRWQVGGMGRVVGYSGPGAGWLAVGVWIGYGRGMKKGMDTTGLACCSLLLVYIHRDAMHVDDGGC
jgi:hypothetical protein